MIHRNIRSVRGGVGAGAGAAMAALLLAACSGGATAATPIGSGSTGPSSASPKATPSPSRAAPAGYGTLTGLPMASAAQVDRPIVVIDIGLGPGRPAPKGLAQADVVYQEFDAAGRSRLIAVYQSQDAGAVGPVVATAPTDWRVTSLMALPVLGFDGGPTGFVKQVGPTVVTPRSSVSFPSLYQHSGSSLYTSTSRLRASAPKAAPAPKGLISFGTSAAGSLTARKVRHLSLTIPGHASESWTWNGRLWIGPGGISATNIVVQNVSYKTLVPSHGSAVQSAQLLGSGTGTVVAGGVSVVCTWYRKALLNITNYVDVHAVPVPLLPGRSWIILAPPGTKAVTS